jgi:hypothetical protein
LLMIESFHFYHEVLDDDHVFLAVRQG